MAQVALAKPCPKCGSLLTYAGQKTDPELTAQCFVCGTHYTNANPEYVVPTEHESKQQEQIIELQKQVEALTGHVGNLTQMVTPDTGETVNPDGKAPGNNG